MINKKNLNLHKKMTGMKNSKKKGVLWVVDRVARV